MHGDAAFSGQGVVYESIQMSALYGYRTGGTIHVIANNQIGFTTCPINSRSGQYTTDLGKSINAPIFHVNADSIDDVVVVCQIAAEFRQKFHHEVIIDIIGYRRLGHNELDQPMFTQPLMYKLINKHPNVRQIYEQQLLDEGVINDEHLKKTHDWITTNLDEAYEKSKTYKFK